MGHEKWADSDRSDQHEHEHHYHDEDPPDQSRLETRHGAIAETLERALDDIDSALYKTFMEAERGDTNGMSADLLGPDDREALRRKIEQKGSGYWAEDLKPIMRKLREILYNIYDIPREHHDLH